MGRTPDADPELENLENYNKSHHDAKKGIAEIPIDIAVNKKSKFLIDTGADVSLIAQKIIRPGILIDYDNKIALSGMFGDGTTVGTVEAKILVEPPIKLQLHVADEISGISCDGILGQDVLFSNTNIEGPSGILRFVHNAGKTDTVVPFTTGNRSEKCVKENMNKETSSDFVKILVNCDRLLNEEQVDTITPNTDFEQNSESAFDAPNCYGTPHELIADTFFENLDFPSHGKTKVIDSKNNPILVPIKTDILIAPRTEKTIFVPFTGQNGNNSFLCKAQEVRVGVYLANCLVKLENGGII